MRVPFGAALVADKSRKKIDELFSGMPNVFGIADDILIEGFDEWGLRPSWDIGEGNMGMQAGEI